MPEITGHNWSYVPAGKFAYGKCSCGWEMKVLLSEMDKRGGVSWLHQEQQHHAQTAAELTP